MRVAAALLVATACALPPTVAVPVSAGLQCVVPEDRSDSPFGPISTDTSTGCVRYDPRQLEAIAREYGPDAVLGMWLHEARHVATLAAFPTTARRDLEADADWHAGCGLALGGASPEPLVALLRDRHTDSWA